MRGAATTGMMVAGLVASGTASADWTGKLTFGGVLACGNTDVPDETDHVVTAVVYSY